MIITLSKGDGRAFAGHRLQGSIIIEQGFKSLILPRRQGPQRMHCGPFQSSMAISPGSADLADRTDGFGETEAVKVRRIPVEDLAPSAVVGVHTDLPGAAADDP